MKTKQTHSFQTDSLQTDSLQTHTLQTHTLNTLNTLSPTQSKAKYKIAF